MTWHHNRRLLDSIRVELLVQLSTFLWIAPLLHHSQGQQSWLLDLGRDHHPLEH